MAYPTIAGYTTGSRTSNATSTSITVPSGTQAEDLMLLLISKDGTGLFTTPSGWEVLENTGSSAQAVGVFYRQLTEPLSNFTIAHASEMTAWILLRIPDGDIPQISTRATGNSTAPNPPSFTHSFGAGTEVMWLAMMGHDYNRTTSAYPSTFPDNRINARSTATGGSGVSMATLNSTTNPQDPEAFRISSTDTWQAYTLAIKTRTTTTTVELASILESSVESTVDLGKVPGPTVMRIDSLLNLAVLGEIVEGAVVNLDKYGVLTIVEIIEGSTFNLSSTGVLTINTVTEGGV